MVGPSQLKLDYPQTDQVEGYVPIEAARQMKAIGSGIFELPVCARCFLGYSCSSHQCKKWKRERNWSE
jgi:hypothetical protein